ncbi:MAG: ribonuclease III [Coriobacteriales bacterium]|jgi:ribonuclease-3|nr:ribonuclease III [Coriobacteriales bacterium]
MPNTDNRHAATLRRAEDILGHHFSDQSLLLRALTHPSAADGDSINNSYERLEFLGDAILGALVSQELYERYPDVPEGGLTRLKVSLVSGKSLAELARSLGLGELIIFGSSEHGTGKRGLSSALEDSLEALIAALALDGGMDVARGWVVGNLMSQESVDLALGPTNPKSALQEIFQVDQITPHYEVTSTSGPPHDRVFTARVIADGRVLASGSGHSKKDAEMAAARVALKQLKSK